MTIEEAIEILYQYSVKDMTYPKEDIEAFELAIKALEQSPCEDAVSRQAVLYALDKRFDSIPMEQTTEILLLRKDLRELPPVTPYKVESEAKEMAENEEDKELIVNKDVYDTLTEEQKKFVDIGLSYFNNRKR